MIKMQVCFTMEEPVNYNKRNIFIVLLLALIIVGGLYYYYVSDNTQVATDPVQTNDDNVHQTAEHIINKTNATNVTRLVDISNNNISSIDFFVTAMTQSDLVDLITAELELSSWSIEKTEPSAEFSDRESFLIVAANKEKSQFIHVLIVTSNDENHAVSYMYI